MTTVSMLLGNVTSGYAVKNSLRFRSSASAYLNRTPASATNRKTWTWSGWVKLGTLSVIRVLFGAGQNSTTGIDFGFLNDNTFFYSINGVGTWTTTAVFRDPSAWYHVVFAFDSTQATQANRSIVYINGVNYAFSSNGVVQNNNYDVNNNIAQYFGYTGVSGTPQYFDGYMAEVNFIDGQALTPSSFGTYDTNGVWQPIKYSGTYGTNGFYLTFGNTTSTTTLGYDTSGNSNNWTTNNISLTAGSTYDSMNDSPTVTSATVANYAVLNPLFNTGALGYLPLVNANLTANELSGSAAWRTRWSTIGVTSGKWYAEFTLTYSGFTSISNGTVAVGLYDGGTATYVGQTANTYGYYSNGNKINNSSYVAYGASYASGDIIGMAFDADAGTLTFYKNGTTQGTAYTGISSRLYYLAISAIWNSPDGVATWNANFGQQPFSYTPPTGFNALNTYNLPTPTIANGAQYMAATTYMGTGATQTISDGTNTAIGTTFQPDLVWIKSRSAATDHALYDVVRGTTLDLASNTTAAETTQSTGLTAFGSTGFTIGALAKINTNAATYVGWQWKGGGTGVTNTNGSITSTVSANTTAGFSIVTYTGTGASNPTIGHGLGVTPNMIILKDRNTNSQNPNWQVYHSSLTSGYFLSLNKTDAQAAISATSYGSVGQPTSTTFKGVAGSVDSTTTNQNTQLYVAYCWAAVPGYSAFGSYTGNGSTDGPFIYTGFRPRFIIAKDATNIDSASWMMQDSSRDTYNVGYKSLYANDPSAESVSSNDNVDILSNGFKIRNASSAWNNSGQTFIYAAFAENPLNYSRAR